MHFRLSALAVCVNCSLFVICIACLCPYKHMLTSSPPSCANESDCASMAPDKDHVMQFAVHNNLCYSMQY